MIISKATKAYWGVVYFFICFATFSIDNNLIFYSPKFFRADPEKVSFENRALAWFSAKLNGYQKPSNTEFSVFYLQILPVYRFTSAKLRQTAKWVAYWFLQLL
ncbi:hypothetical protein [Adhaeribacter rhizoryzae]|uniref:Uncharacterized protein n=1 Tax=Adhaeribacter rhizoryzae TaxID=2607907 RepID=A0A5M6D1L2_9BACT|nr:hypothetical protein [Adhaeribacter rhizoryzae]KAA5541213.1 hypothetical protein F0145_21525 [Adhaeribacter rhizoryzae]